jgi:uncharacterized damage-inducible protein DinB
MMDAAERYRVLAAAPSMFRSIVEPLDDATLDFREAPNAWTIRQVLCHVTDAEVTDWPPRIRRILSDDTDRRFTPFDREGGFTAYAGWDRGRLLDEFARLRRENLALLRRVDADPALPARTGLHPEFGDVTMEQLLATWVTHDAAHLAQVSRVLTRYLGQHIGPWTKYFSLLRRN